MGKHPLIQMQRGARVASLHCEIASVLGQGGLELWCSDKRAGVGRQRPLIQRQRGTLAARLRLQASESWEIGCREKRERVAIHGQARAL